jgi:uncharacterized protein YkwD
MQGFSQWVELILVAILSYHAVDGYYRGFFLLFMETIGFLVALVGASLTYRFAAAWLESRFDMPHFFAGAVAFLAIWMAIDLSWPLIIKKVYKRVPEKWRHAKANQLAGILPGVVNGVLLFSVLLSVLLAFPIPPAIKAKVTQSPVARPMIRLASKIDAAMKPVLGPLAEQSLNLLTINPGTEDRLDLHFTLHDTTVDASSEQEMLISVNAERTSRGLVPLEWSNGLRDVARNHSIDMFGRGYFSHINPDGQSPSDRADAAGVKYGIVGENLALAPTNETAHQGLMESPGHRANILNPDFRKVGIGIIDGGVYGKMYTQLFSD